MARKIGALAIALVIAMLGFSWATSSALAAATGWTPPEDISSDGGASEAQVEIDDDNNATATWRDNDTIMLSRHPANGAWSAPEAISQSEQNSLPALAVNGEGRVLVAWTSASDTVHVKEFGPDGTELSSTELASQDAFSISDPAVAQTDEGAAVVIWGTAKGMKYLIHAAGEEFGGEQAAGPEGTVVYVDVTVSDEKAFLFWSLDHSGISRVNTTSHTFGADDNDGSTPISPENAYAIELASATSPDGDVVVVWHSMETEWDDVYGNALVDGVWMGAERISENHSGAYEPSIAIGGTGQAIIAWLTWQSEKTVAWTTWMRSYGFGDPWTFASAENPASLRVDSSSGGASLLTWREGSGMDAKVKAAIKQPTDALFATTEIATGRVRPPASAISSEGNAVVVWPQIISSDQSSLGGQAMNDVKSGTPLRAAGFDAAPAKLSNLQVPAKAVVGESISTSISTWDVWDHNPEIKWSFGDGTAATGGKAKHVFAKPGEYEVTAVATNVTGKPSSPAKATIKVVGAPKPKRKVLLALVAPKKVKIVKGKVLVTLVNKGNRAASGTLRLWTKARRWRRGANVVGAAKFKLAVGQKKALMVPLTRDALNQIRSKQNKKLRVKATATYTEAGVKPGKKPKPKKASRKLTLTVG